MIGVGGFRTLNSICCWFVESDLGAKQDLRRRDSFFRVMTPQTPQTPQVMVNTTMTFLFDVSSQRVPEGHSYRGLSPVIVL